MGMFIMAIKSIPSTTLFVAIENTSTTNLTTNMNLCEF